MNYQRTAERPLDKAMRERLHLRSGNTVVLKLIRGLIHTGDTVSRTLFGHPLIALRESEALFDQVDGLKGQALVNALLARDGGTTITAHGLQNIPATGPVIIASTHPTGIFDFPAHARALLEKRPDMKVVANQETEKFLGAESIIPVTINKQNRAVSGKQTRQAMLNHLANDGAVLIFGSGRVPDSKQGQLVEPAWRNGSTLVSLASQAPIVPATLDARNSRAYYRIRAIARFLSGGNDHFGAMVASLRYTAELIEKLGGRYDVHYGKLLPPGADPATLKQAAESLVPGQYQA